MAATIHVAQSWDSEELAHSADKTVYFCDSGVYWFLYRYFEGANLDQQAELIDLYGGREIDGYQLDRLEDELRSALDDIKHKPEQWKVLTGWTDHPARENEIWRDVEKSEVEQVVKDVLALVAISRMRNLKLIVLGD